MRAAVGRIESEWQEELGAARFAQLRELLVDLNETRLVREVHGSRPVRAGPGRADARPG
jgi:hypothetical protein